MKMYKSILLPSLVLMALFNSTRADQTSPFNDGRVPIIEYKQNFEKIQIDPTTGDTIVELDPYIVRPFQFEEEKYLKETKKDIQSWTNKQLSSDLKKFRLLEGGIFKKLDFGRIEADIGISWTKKNRPEWALIRVKW